MITDESTELRKYLFNRIDVKDSKEVRDLYSFLDNIQLKPLHIEHYHVKHKHSLEIEPSDFIPDNIIKKTYIMNRTTIHFTVGKLKVKLFIHSKEDSKKFINIIVSVIQYVCSLSIIDINELSINYYLLKNKKEINKNTKEFTKNEINSGYCKDGPFKTEITIYRIEEVVKVTIHELFHALQYDYRNDPLHIINHYKNKYNITSTKLKSYEAYTEIWANIINIYLISKKSKRSPYNIFITLLALEKEFCEFQSHKVFYVTNLGDKPTDINKKTGIFPYFILRCELYQRLNLFIKHCRLHNIDYVKIDKEEKWFNFLKKNTTIKKNNRRFNKFNENSIIYKTMRMSINEIKVTDE